MAERPDSTDTLSHEDRRILEKKVLLDVDREVRVISQEVPDEVVPDDAVPAADRTRALIEEYGSYVDYINQLLAKIKTQAIALRYNVVYELEPSLAAALNALWEGNKTDITYSDYVEALEFEVSVSQEILNKGQGGETTYLQQLRGSAIEVAKGFERKLLADNEPSDAAGPALLARSLIVARTTAATQSTSLSGFSTSNSGSTSGSSSDNNDDATTIFGKEVVNTFTKIASGDDPIQTILDDCIPCLDRALDMDLQAPLEGFLDDLEADLDTRWSVLQNIADLLDSDDVYEDICDLLDFFSFQCIPDLVAILSLLLWYYKSLITSFSLDINGSLWTLLGMIMGPFFSSLESVIDQYISMLMAPVDCIIDSLIYQMSKIPQLSTDYEFLLERQREQAAFRTRAAIGDEEIASINAAIDAKLNVLALKASSWDQSKRAYISDPGSQSTYATPLTEEYKPQTRVKPDGTVEREEEVVEDYHEYIADQEKKQTEQATIADYLRDTETVLETGLGAIGGYLIEARDKLNSWLESILEDIRGFLGGSGDDFTLAVSFATTIKRLARLIAFIKALIKMADEGLQCGPERNITEPDVLTFLNNFVAEIGDGSTIVIDDDNNIVIVPPDSERPTVQTTTVRGGQLTPEVVSGEAPDIGAETARGITITLSDCINKVDIADLRKVNAWIKEISS